MEKKFKYYFKDGTMIELPLCKIKKIIENKGEINTHNLLFSIPYSNNNNNNINDNNDFKNQIIFRLIKDIDLIKKEKEEVNRLKNLNIYYLNRNQAKMVGKLDEWWRIITELINITNQIMPINIDYAYFFMKEQNIDNSSVTPSFFVDLIKKYKDKSEQEILNDINKIRKKK